MDRRAAAEAVARNIVSAATAAGVPITTLAQATDIDPAIADERMHSSIRFTLAQLGRVGGFFRIPVSSLLEGVPA